MSQGQSIPQPAKVVFACVHGAGRSQMAAAFFNALADPELARAFAAGIQPAERVPQKVVEVMNESGIDLAHIRPRLLTAELLEGAAVVVTMGCGEECPAVPGARREDWPLVDPSGPTLLNLRPLRDEIRRRVSELIQRAGWGNRALVAP